MFVSFFGGLSVFLLALGVSMSVLFHLANEQMLEAPDGKAIGIVLVLVGFSIMLGTIGAAGFR